MRVLHLNNIAGVPVNLSRGLRGLGVDSKVTVFRPDTVGYGFDDNLDVDRFPRPIQPLYRLAKLKDYLDYDIYHYHSCSFVTGYIDAPLLKAAGKKIVYHHHGSDIRGKGIPFLSRFCHARYISTPDMFDWAPQAEWLPNPIFREDFKKYLEGNGKQNQNNNQTQKEAGKNNQGNQKQKEQNQTQRNNRKQKTSSNAIKVAHSSKGLRAHRETDFVESVCRKLQKEGLVEWVPLEGLPRNKFLEQVSSCDVYVDSLGGGWYGMAALEAMSMKKCVSVYIREDLHGYADLNAYADANKRNFEEVLRGLTEDEKLRKKYAQKGYDYVKRVHDADKIAKRVLKKYEEIL
ncbi:glycosyltransferase [Candidatus Micrarchaeota archaeon]|nr:glycosyltransferase [Candidatus Micrarchaeota archaeon]